MAFTSASGTVYVCNGLAGLAAAPLAYGFFYALMPPDNAATVAAGAAIEFPRDGATSGVTRVNATQFRLPTIGVYEISWQVSVTEAGQLVVGLDSGGGVIELPESVAGRATGTSQITNTVLVTTSVVNSVVSIRNPTGNTPALTITPLAGGTRPVSATLVIKQLQ